MDTDDFSEMAWGIIVRAGRVSDTLKVELGALSRKYRSEDDWLRGVREHLEEIVEDPDDYVEFWHLEEFEGVTAGTIRELATELCRRVDEVLATSLNERGNRCYM